MTDTELDALIDAGTSVLGSSIENSWRVGIRQHLRVSLTHGLSVGDFTLPDEFDPAPVFSP